MSIESRIADALMRRDSQRDFVRQLGEAWGALAEDVADLARALADADSALRGLGPDTQIRQRVGDGLGALLRATDGGPSRLGETQRRVAETTAALTATSRRINRDTVNLGVVGVAKAGKSTMLRSMTGLSIEVVPSSAFSPTTAAPSLIFHRAGSVRAVVHLHDWASFRDSYLERLHHSARLRQAPRTQADFAVEPYDPVRADTTTQPYLEKLLVARNSLHSYRDLLGAGLLTLNEHELRPYVAYPLDDADLNRPYHAVRSVEIYCPFPNVSVAKLGLVDMPGEDEAGLNVEELFIERLRTEVDLLLLLKRPAENTAFFTGADEKALSSVEAARGGVELRDAFRVVLNPDLVDALPEHLSNARMKIDERLRGRGIGTFEADVNDPVEVADKVLEPALQHLADRLAEMDRAVVGAALKDVESTAAEVGALAADLIARVRDWRTGQPNEETRLAILSRSLRNKISYDLRELRDSYDQLVRNGEVDPDLGAAITAAGERARVAVAGGFGKGRERWTEETRNAFAGREYTTKEMAHIEARGYLAEVFDDIDVSLDRAVRRVWAQIAQVLHEGLADELVPAVDDGRAALSALRERADARDAEHLPAAIDDLLGLRDDYGSLVLRVTRPILRKISMKPPPEPAPTASGGLIENAVAGAVATGAANAVGLPQAAPLVEAVWWKASENVKSAVSTPAAEEGDAAAFIAELTQKVEDTIKKLEEALHGEAGRMPAALAAAVDRFWDAAFVAEFTEMDIERICGPIRDRIWPSEFAGDAAVVAVDLARIADRGQALQRDVDAVRALNSALLLRPPGSGNA